MKSLIGTFIKKKTSKTLTKNVDKNSKDENRKNLITHKK